MRGSKKVTNFAVMISLIRHIEYLMMNNDCVVIPGWGALIAQYSESFYNEQSHVIQKPQRQVAFNAAVNHNDGLLAQSLIRRERITYAQAVQCIDQNVESFKKLLARGEELSFGRLGFFHATSRGHIEFVPFYHEMANEEYFGLRSVKFRTLAEIEAEQQAQLQFEHAVAAAMQPHQHSWRRWAQMAASVAVLISLAVLLSTPIVSNQETNPNYASLNLPQVKKVTATTPVVEWSDAQEAPLAVALPRQALADVHQRAAKKVVAQPDADVTALIDRVGAISGEYFLIISTMSSEKQAQKFIEAQPDLQGRMHLAQAGKRFRVYVARSDNRESLETIRKMLPQRYQDAWVGN